MQIGRDHDGTDIAVEQVVAVGRGLRGQRTTDHPAAAAAVVNDDLLPKQGRQAQRQQACDDIHRFACRIRHDDTDRTVGIRLLRPGRLLHSEQRSGEKNHACECFHQAFPVNNELSLNNLR